MKILFINPYFGKLPFWMDSFLLSCETNREFEWLIPTDCDFPEEYPVNVKFIKSTLKELCDKASVVTGLSINFDRPYKLCDLRPAFGLIYSEHLTGYDYWGHCDFDVIWGRINNYINHEILSKYNIISSRKGRMSGHFSLYRNNDFYNNLFKKHPLWKLAMTNQKSYFFDEVGMTEVIKESKLEVYWEKFLFNSSSSDIPGISHLSLNTWVWKDGRVINTQENQEVMYVNFMNLKDWLVNSDVYYSKKPRIFYLSFTHFSIKKAFLPKLSIKHFKAFIKYVLKK